MLEHLWLTNRRALSALAATAPGPHPQAGSKPQRKDNMSKEMKSRLRQEYLGLGGAENKVSSGGTRACLWVGCGSLLLGPLGAECLGTYVSLWL